VTGSAWVDISDEAKDFVKKLLNKCVAMHLTFRSVSLSPIRCIGVRYAKQFLNTWCESASRIRWDQTSGCHSQACQS
jgi:hypothetical protein